MTANSARQCDPQLAKIYSERMVLNGQHHTPALCAVVTRLAARIFMTCRIGSSRAAIIGTLEPLVTVILAMLVLHDRATPWQLVGGALIVASIAVREGTELFLQSTVTT